MSERQPTNSRAEVQASVSGSSFLLQRACACGGSAGLDDQCEGCRQAKLTGQAAPIQPKLRIGPADDHYERQADRVADTVMRMPATGAPGFSIERITPLVQRQPVDKDEEAQTERLQRQPIEEEEGELQPKRLQRQPVEEEEEEEMQASRLQRQPLEEEEEEMQMKRAPSGGGAAHSRLAGTHRGGGQPLPTTERTFFEPRLGFDFSDVRVHTNADAAASARAVAARAYTVGRDVVFGAGQWAPGTDPGRRLIAHELVHVAQQRGNRAIQLKPSIKKCTKPKGREQEILDAVDEAKLLAKDALRVLKKEMPLSYELGPLIDNFGSLSATQKTMVIERYEHIDKNLDSKQIVCTNKKKCKKLCGQGVIGGNKILLCPSFGTLACPPGATILHEAAHNAGAKKDIDKGKKYPPKNAQNNAYSYEHFPLEISTGPPDVELGPKREVKIP